MSMNFNYFLLHWQRIRKENYWEKRAELKVKYKTLEYKIEDEGEGGNSVVLHMFDIEINLADKILI